MVMVKAAAAVEAAAAEVSVGDSARRACSTRRSYVSGGSLLASCSAHSAAHHTPPCGEMARRCMPPNGRAQTWGVSGEELKGPAHQHVH